MCRPEDAVGGSGGRGEESDREKAADVDEIPPPIRSDEIIVVQLNSWMYTSSFAGYIYQKYIGRPCVYNLAANSDTGETRWCPCNPSLDSP